MILDIRENLHNIRLWALAISMLMHIFIFSNVNYNLNFNIPSKKYIELDIFEKPKIVPDSKAPEKKIETNNLAAKNTATDKEQVKKGETQKLIKEKAANKQSYPLIAKQEKPQIDQKSETQKQSKSIDNANLLLSENDLNKFSSDNFKPKSKVSDSQRVKTLNSNYQPFRQNRLFENFGTAAYLPQIQEGEVTLLNAKADQHAVFVRRVAIQVFSHLRAKNWSHVGFAQARQTKKFTTVEAVMNNKGKLVSYKLTDNSGSPGFDLVLQEAVKDGVWDQNPQMSAALEDGNIHFIFQAKTWAEIVGDPGRERRWLLLATGLK